jgi:hypothetical protein
MGVTGSGKGTFINSALGITEVVGDSLDSFTDEVRAYGCPHPDGSGRRVVLVDTPGFDDSLDRTDADILMEIANWLTTTWVAPFRSLPSFEQTILSSYKNQIQLTGLLYIHRISDNRLGGMPLRNLQMFQQLVGEQALDCVILTTTHWDMVDKNVALEREAELRTAYWRPMIAAGSRMARFDRTRTCAWEILSMLPSQRRTLKLQVELVDHHLTLEQTSAGKALLSRLQQLIDKFLDMIRKVEARLGGRPKGSYTTTDAILLDERASLERRLTFTKMQKEKIHTAPERKPRHSFASVVRMVMATQPPKLPLEPSVALPKRGLPSENETCEDDAVLRGQQFRRRALATTITLLDHAKDIADLAPVPWLKGAVGLAQTIIQTVDVFFPSLTV